MSGLMQRPHDGNPRWINRPYTHVVYPLFEPQNYKGLLSRLREHARREELSLEENRDLQWSRLLRLLEHAYSTSPFYRQRFDRAGLRPSDLASPADLKRLPCLTREDLRNHLPEIQSRRYRSEELLRAATGGTTDTPVPLLRDPESIREKAAVQWQFNSWAGLYPGDRVLNLWGAQQDYCENPSWRWRLYDRYLMRQVWAPTSLFNESVLERYRQSLNQFRPRIVYAYPSPLALFCEYLRDSGKPYHRPVSAICTAETLLETQRQVIEGTLGCPVFEQYGSREFAMIAAECEQHQGMHLNPAAAYVEFVPFGSAEGEGLHEILVTDLLNYGMPLIRYRINDCALSGPESCACGRGYPLIRRILGRTTDIFYLPNGDVVPGISLQNRVIQVCPGLKKIQVIQETLGEFRLRYVPGPTFGPSDLELLKAGLRRYFGDGVNWTFEQVADIERERSGKTRFCISHVTKPLEATPSGKEKSNGARNKE